MTQARHAVTIKRTIAGVFSYLADGENATEWLPGR